MSNKRFSELVESSKMFAVNDYLQGWNETREEDDKMDYEEALEILEDNEDDWMYNINGEYISEEE